MDKKELREQLQDYYGTAMLNGFPAAMADLNDLEDMDEEELEKLAEEAGISAVSEKQS